MYITCKIFGINNQLIKFAIYKKCCKLYTIKDLSTNKPYKYVFQDYSNYLINNLRFFYDNIIIKQMLTNEKQLYRLLLIFLIISIRQRLQKLYNTKGFEESYRKWINKSNNK